ncbi:hypothetical protein ACFYPZ_40930 [Streptomyces sp. NPDC005506]|uniref:hypothetical protein n=1 Tax=unclassified Streptomyces TaxID=2593676 RepID=UPI0036BB49C1
MKIETRDRMYLGVRVKAEDVFQLADKAVDLMGETAAVELTVRKEAYEIVANSPSDLIAALGEDDYLARSASLTVNSSRGSIRLDISPQRGVGTARLFIPYLRMWASFLHVRHEVPDTANALFDEASTLLRRRVCGKNGGFPHGFLYTQALVLFLLSAAGRALFLHPTWADVWWILGISLSALLVEHLIFDPTVRLRPHPARPQRRSWHPSEASVARWTVIAGVLAIPALLIGVVALFTG